VQKQQVLHIMKVCVSVCAGECSALVIQHVMRMFLTDVSGLPGYHIAFHIALKGHRFGKKKNVRNWHVLIFSATSA
jgi:hypothetical protein